MYSVNRYPFRFILGGESGLGLRERPLLPNITTLHPISLILVVVCFSLRVVGLQLAPVEPASKSPISELPPIAISDNTPIPLRFAEGFYSKCTVAIFRSCDRGEPKNANPAKPGQKIRLVVTRDFAVNRQVVIARGAPAEATITRVDPRDQRLPDTGLHLHLDWVQTITGSHIALRHSHGAEPDSFRVDVEKRKGGFEVRPLTPKRTLTAGAILGLSLLNKENWVPAGSRIMAYTAGDATLDPVQVSAAQTFLLQANLNAVLTVYRLKDKADGPVSVICDDGKVGELDRLHFIVAELPPGKHRCSIDRSKGQEIEVAAGQEYFLQVKHRGTGGWKIEQISPEEGEDAIAAAQAVNEASNNR